MRIVHKHMCICVSVCKCMGFECLCLQVASGEAIIQTLQGWDISLTDSMLKKMEAEQVRTEGEAKKQKEVETEL